MGEEIYINKIQNRILYSLCFSIIMSLIVGLNYTLIQGYYVFVILFLLISLTLVLSNLELVKLKLEITTSKLMYLFVGVISFIIISLLFNTNLGYPLIPSMGLSILCLLFFNWVYYSLEPLRG